MNDATTLDGLLPEHVSANLTDASVSLRADAAVYPLAAVYGAAYVFIDRCYVLIDQPAPAQFRVTLATRSGQADAATLRALVGEFANELLACAWRHQITQDNRAVIEAVATQALAGAMGPPSLDELEQFDFAEESFEDPLGIAMSWEEKYKKKSAESGAKADGAADPASAAGAPAAGSGDAEEGGAGGAGGGGAEGGA